MKRTSRWEAVVVVVRLALLIALVEFLVMGVLAGRDLDPVTEAILDTTLLSAFLTPMIYLLLYRPLRRQISGRLKVEQELREALEKQKRLYAELEAARDQLLESEKLVSMGQLAAGVAHEINNPVGYVSSNLKAMREYTDGLLELIALYEQAHPLIQRVPETWDAIERKRAELDLGFLKDDLAGLISESEEGLARVRRLVQNLKDFARSDEGVQELLDLNEELERALNIVHNELKYHTEVVRELAADLPRVKGVPSQIGQVFVNILVNAGQAIEERGTITVRSAREGNEIRVSISDTGCGMTPEQMQRLFEPFYTTKPRGKGTGLGLSVSWGIVSRHGGRIEVESAPGEGSTFHIILPVAEEA